MGLSLYTIPVQEIFEPKEGCPFCRLYHVLEERCVDYILGAAMMEPAIRQETNRLGFCSRHLELMLAQRNKLPLALVLQSHLETLQKELFEKNIFNPPARRAKKAGESDATCYICSKIDDAFDKIMENTLVLYEKDPSFRELFAQQEQLCLPHYLKLAGKIAVRPKKEAAAEQKAAQQLCQQALDTLTEDVTHFAKMFDYRNQGGDWKNSRDALERAARFLTGIFAEDSAAPGGKK